MIPCVDCTVIVYICDVDPINVHNVGNYILQTVYIRATHILLKLKSKKQTNIGIVYVSVSIQRLVSLQSDARSQMIS